MGLRFQGSHVGLKYKRLCFQGCDAGFGLARLMFPGFDAFDPGPAIFVVLGAGEDGHRIGGGSDRAFPDVPLADVGFDLGDVVPVHLLPDEGQ